MKRNNQRWRTPSLFLIFFTLSFLSCTEDPSQQLCQPTTTQPCVCSNQEQGTKTCSDDGRFWSHCACKGNQDKETTQHHERQKEHKQETQYLEKTSDENSPSEPGDASQDVVPEHILEQTENKEHKQVPELLPESQQPEEQVQEATKEQKQQDNHPSDFTYCQPGDQLSCYTGERGCSKDSSGIYQCQGTCKAGIRTCKNGHWTTCQGEVHPTADIQDGKDNNCNGFTDEMIQDMTSGPSHNCVLWKNGAVKCWGNNSHGQLGNGKKQDKIVSYHFNLPSAAKQISAGTSYTCALLNNGTVLCWGSIDTDTGRTSHTQPTRIQFLTQVKQISAGGSFTCVLLENGTVKCWGSNLYGQLGNGTKSSKSTAYPKSVQGLSKIQQISAGRNHACALLANKTVKCWGKNSHGQLGNGNTQTQSTPVQVKNLSNVKQISTGESHTCALLESGKVQCWGYNIYEQAGVKGKYSVETPTTIVSIQDGSKVITGRDHTCILRKNGSIKCLGRNNRGQLGDGKPISSSSRSSIPLEVQGLTNVKLLSAGYEHTCAIQKNDVVKCWGSHHYGELGSRVKNTKPSQFADLFTVSASVCGKLHDATVQCWGTKSYLVKKTSKPTNIPNLTNVSELALGGSHQCVLQQDKSVKCWGYNSYGQLGDGKTNTVESPSQAKNILSNVKQISLGAYHSCALLTKGTVQCWGQNKYGQLGHGSTTDASTPAFVKGLSNVKQISARDYHTCALLSNGTVKCWGYNKHGQLGDGTNQQALVPTLVPNITNAKQLSVGYEFGCVLLNNGTVKCWGRNDYGQLGSNVLPRDNQPPVEIKSLPPSIKQISAGYNHICALLKNHSVMCWGSGDSKHFSEISGIKTKPVQVPAQFLVKKVVSGTYFTCFLYADHTFSCHGTNSSGQLGNTQGQSSSVPLEVQP